MNARFALVPATSVLLLLTTLLVQPVLAALPATTISAVYYLPMTGSQSLALQQVSPNWHIILRLIPCRGN